MALPVYLNDRSCFETINYLVSDPIPTKENIQEAEAIFAEATRRRIWIIPKNDVSDPISFRGWVHGRRSYYEQAAHAIALASVRYQASLSPRNPLDFQKEEVRIVEQRPQGLLSQLLKKKPS